MDPNWPSNSFSLPHPRFQHIQFLKWHSSGFHLLVVEESGRIFVWEMKVIEVFDLLITIYSNFNELE